MTLFAWPINWWDTKTTSTKSNALPNGKDALRTINEDTVYTVRKADFGFTDSNTRDTLAGVRIDSVPGRGSLKLDGVAVSAGQFIATADIDAGKLVYSPAPNESGNGYANFSFSVKDSAGGFDKTPNAFCFNVCPVNDAPDAHDDTATTKAATAVTVDVKANDSDPDNTRAELTVTRASLVDPSKGSVTVNADGTLTFTPAAGVSGPVEIQYTIKDPGGLTDTAKLTVDVKPPVVPDPQPEQCISFDFTGNSKLDGADGNLRSYTVSGVSVNVSAFSREKGATGAWSSAWLGAYGGGLGVTDSQEGTGGGNGHTVDNICRDNFLLFEFDQQVELDRAYLGYVVHDSDIKVWIGNVPGAFDQHIMLSDAVLRSMGFTEVNQTTLTSARWADLNAGGFLGNVIVIAADTTDTSPEDQFKLQKLEVCTVVPADTPPEGADVTRSTAEDTAYVVRAADFGFRDADGHTLAAVRIDSLPAAGSLTLNGAVVAAGQLIAVADIDAGNLRFTPAPDAFGSPYASFTFTVRDSSNSFDLQPNTFTVNVTPVNDGPAARPDTGSTDEDTSLTVSAAAGVINSAAGSDSDPEGDTLNVTGVSFGATSVAAGAELAGANGTLVLNADGSYTYRPAASAQALGVGASVQDRFDYTISDGNGGNASSTLTITVNGANDGPSARPDTGNTNEDSVLEVSAAAGVINSATGSDSDPDGDTLNVTGVSFGATSVAAGAELAGAHGTLVLRANGSYTYRPAASTQALGVGESVQDRFDYTVSDGNGGSASSTLTITVSGANDGPNARPDSGSTDEDTALTVSAADGVLDSAAGSDSDPEGDTLRVTGVGFGDTTVSAGTRLQGANGELVLNVDGSYTYTPAASTQALGVGDTVQDQFIYSITDGNGGAASSTLTITVNGTNDAPIGEPDRQTTPQGQPATGNVLDNDRDPDGDALRVLSFSVGGRDFVAGAIADLDGVGSLRLDANGEFVFTPLPAFRGAAPVVTYTLSDGALSATSTLSLVVDPVNQPPQVDAGIGAVASEEGLAGGLADTAGTPADLTDLATFSGQVQVSDPDNDPLTIRLEPPAGAWSSAGVAITWSGAGTQTLIGSAGATEVLRVAIGNGGAYSVTLAAPLDHPQAGVEDVLTLGVGLVVSDGNASTRATLSIRVEDDAPLVANVTRDAGPIPFDTNLMFVLDLSGSMTLPSGVQVPRADGSLVELSRLELEIQAIDSLITRYQDAGEVRVRIVTFSDDAAAVGSEWVDATTARAQLATLQTVNWTNYDAALKQAVLAYDDAGRLADAKSAIYFLSDGDPTAADNGGAFGSVALNGDIGIQIEEEEAWRSFLTNEGVTAFAIGLGNAALTADSLNPVAFDGLYARNTDGVLVEDLAELSNQLLDTFETVSTGSLAANDTLGSLGADGGHVASVTVDNVTFAFDPQGNGGTGSVTPPSASARFDTVGNHLAVDTNAGGTLVVDFDTGVYRYVANPSTDYVESFRFTYVDGDGDGAEATLTVNVAAGGGGVDPNVANRVDPRDLIDTASLNLEALLPAGAPGGSSADAEVAPSAPQTPSTTALLAQELLQRAETPLL